MKLDVRLIREQAPELEWESVVGEIVHTGEDIKAMLDRGDPPADQSALNRIDVMRVMLDELENRLRVRLGKPPRRSSVRR